VELNVATLLFFSSISESLSSLDVRHSFGMV
jgi:hypothetical protein